MELSVRIQSLDPVLNSFNSLLDLEWFNLEIGQQNHQIKSHVQGCVGMALKGHKGEFPILDVEGWLLTWFVSVTIIRHGRSFLLSGLGFGCVGLASAQTLVSPRRNGGASYHLICVLFLDLMQDFKLRHYPKIEDLGKIPETRAAMACDIPIVLNSISSPAT